MAHDYSPVQIRLCLTGGGRGGLISYIKDADRLATSDLRTLRRGYERLFFVRPSVHARRVSWGDYVGFRRRQGGAVRRSIADRRRDGRRRLFLLASVSGGGELPGARAQTHAPLRAGTSLLRSPAYFELLRVLSCEIAPIFIDPG